MTGQAETAGESKRPPLNPDYFRGERRRIRRLNLGLLLCLALVGLLALGSGPAALPLGDILRGLLLQRESTAGIILWEIRVPRVLLAMLVGASLGMAGAALQGLLRNPLAEPGLIGVSASAGLGAVIALYFGWAAVFPLSLPATAMAGALLSTAVLYGLAARDASTLTLILAGVAISSLAVSLISLAMNLAPSPYALSEMVFWLLGSLKDRSNADVTLALPFIVTGWLLLLAGGRWLDALALGEEAAQSLGVPLRLVRAAVILGTTLAVGASVAVSGAIGFVGLVVPHLLRPWVGYQAGSLLIPSALGGALLLTTADLAVRLVTLQQELMLGVVTGIIGAPFFFHLILKTRRDMR